MTNMSYCRFENTLADLRDCHENMHDDELSEDEGALNPLVDDALDDRVQLDLAASATPNPRHESSNVIARPLKPALVQVNRSFDRRFRVVELLRLLRQRLLQIITRAASPRLGSKDVHVFEHPHRALPFGRRKLRHFDLSQSFLDLLVDHAAWLGSWHHPGASREGQRRQPVDHLALRGGATAADPREPAGDPGHVRKKIRRPIHRRKRRRRRRPTAQAERRGRRRRTRRTRLLKFSDVPPQRGLHATVWRQSRP